MTTFELDDYYDINADSSDYESYYHGLNSLERRLAGKRAPSCAMILSAFLEVDPSYLDISREDEKALYCYSIFTSKKRLRQLAKMWRLLKHEVNKDDDPVRYKAILRNYRRVRRYLKVDQEKIDQLKAEYIKRERELDEMVLPLLEIPFEC